MVLTDHLVTAEVQPTSYSQKRGGPEGKAKDDLVRKTMPSTLACDFHNSRWASLFHWPNLPAHSFPYPPSPEYEVLLSFLVMVT